MLAMKTRLLILFLIGMFVFSAIPPSFAQYGYPSVPSSPENIESETQHDVVNVYEDSEEMRMASEKVYFSEESLGFGGGTSMLNGSDFQLSTIIIAIVIGIGSFFGLMVFWRKRK